MLKALLVPLVVLGVIFAPVIIIAVNILALVGIVVYSLYSGIREGFYHTESKAV
jgi:ABC-type transporter Mla maintaining outer membrane lipid asymmetry permease subunit MlaE